MTARDIDPRQLTRRLIADILELDPERVRGEDRLREDLGMDSLGSLELLSSLSSELKLDIEAEEAMDITTVDEACAFVARRLTEGQGGVRHPAL